MENLVTHSSGKDPLKTSPGDPDLAALNIRIGMAAHPLTQDVAAKRDEEQNAKENEQGYQAADAQHLCNRRHTNIVNDDLNEPTDDAAKTATTSCQNGRER